VGVTGRGSVKTAEAAEVAAAGDAELSMKMSRDIAVTAVITPVQPQADGVREENADVVLGR
jgi:hypothetical protein